MFNWLCLKDYIFQKYLLHRKLEFMYSLVDQVDEIRTIKLLSFYKKNSY